MSPAQICCLIIFLSIASFHSLSRAAPANSSDAVLYDILPFIRVYKNGTVQRFIGQDFAPPSPSLPGSGGVLSKDLKFSENPDISARIYLPLEDPARGSEKLPLLIYFHGGGFFAESAFSPSYHRPLNMLAARARVVVVSVNYRLAPESPLPIAYDDSWLAIKWSFSQSTANGTDPWMTKHADFSRVYLGGDSAGANIAHNMAIRIGLHKPEQKQHPGIRITGMFLNCPYFLGKNAIGNESAYPYLQTQMQKLWLYGYPNSKSGLDNPLVNPAKNRNLRRLGCLRVVVFVAGNDGLRFRAWYYVTSLRNSGWKGHVKVVNFEGENHVFNLANPSSPNALRMLRLLSAFLNEKER